MRIAAVAASLMGASAGVGVTQLPVAAWPWVPVCGACAAVALVATAWLPTVATLASVGGFESTWRGVLGAHEALWSSFGTVHSIAGNVVTTGLLDDGLDAGNGTWW